MFDQIYDFVKRLGYTHPLHPMEVHLPIGMVMGALIFALVAVIFKRERLRLTPYYCIILAFIWIFPTAFFGIMDWQHFYKGAWLMPIKVKLVGTPTLACLLLTAILLGRKYGSTSRKVLPFYFLCFLSVVVLGYFGGKLVFENKTTIGPAEYKVGEKIFDANCSSCHPHGGNVIEPSKPILHSDQLKNLTTFLAEVRHPKEPMPAFPVSQISDAQVKDLYEYIDNVLEHRTKVAEFNKPGNVEGDNP